MPGGAGLNGTVSEGRPLREDLEQRREAAFKCLGVELSKERKQQVKRL